MMLAKAPFYLLPKELKLAIVDSQRLAGVGSLRQQSVSSQSSGRTAKRELSETSDWLEFTECPSEWATPAYLSLNDDK